MRVEFSKPYFYSLLMAVAIIAYGSLYPWQRLPVPTPFLIWPHAFTRDLIGDVGVNIIIYMPIGLFGFFALAGAGRRMAGFVFPVILGLLLSLAMESAQTQLPLRQSSLLDLLANGLGSALGVVTGSVVRTRYRPEILLVLIWTAYQVLGAVGILAGRHPPSITFVLIEWLVVLYLCFNERPASWRPFVAAAYLGVIVLRELWPLRWSSAATAFSWVPFYASLQQEWIQGVPVLLGKAFSYGAAIWLLRRAGVRLWASTGLVASILFAAEWLQRHLPGRTPEITDPILALILGVALMPTAVAVTLKSDP